MPAGVALEKAEGKYFTHDDYEKLDNILSNKRSSLKNIYKEEVVGSETTEGVDGVSGATIILNTNDCVKGAVWTCYTLWHWVNGEVYNIIRDITGKELSRKALADHLRKEEIPFKIFALEQIIKRKNYEPEMIQLVLDQVSTLDYSIQKLMITYFEKASARIYFTSLGELLKNGTPDLRILCLNSLLNDSRPPIFSFFEQLSLQFF